MAEIENIPFVKMQGTGNDFVVLNNLESRFTIDEIIKLTPKLCHRKYGVGADGLLALQKPVHEHTDYEMLYRNADGSDAGMCGNGSRCLALYASQLGMGKEMSFSVHDNIYTAKILGEATVEVSFPLSAEIRKITVGSDKLLQVFTGTEHVVMEVSDKELKKEDKLIEKGRSLRYHEYFEPKGTNANFFCGLDEHHLKVQTYERGVENLTLACGTGAIASAIAWHHKQQPGSTDNEFTVETKGGKVIVSFVFNTSEGVYNNIKLTGPAHFVFKGSFYV